MKYRPDVDGLRALAVVPVVLFHADVQAFSGGFVGVDVFLVISGYLITRLLLADFAQDRFSLRHFYTRRVRRIFPALLAMVLVTLVAGFFLLLPGELREAGRATEKIAYFFSNHLFWHTQNDYWQQNALATQPLLHTWSLAVEEQFYLIIPALLALWHWKARARSPQALLLLLAIASAACSLWLMARDPAAAFYTLPPRAWELLLGGLLACRVAAGGGRPARPWVAELAGASGLAMILWAIFLYTARTPFPGLHAALPSVGALLIIYAGSGSRPSAVSRLLAWRPLVFIGLLSYSMYLWHWPLLVMLRSAGWQAYGMPALPLAVLLALILLVSWLSWRFIEQPLRHGRPGRPDNRVLGVAVLALLLCFGAGALTQRIATTGRPWAQILPPALQQLDRDMTRAPGIACEGRPDPAQVRAGQGGCTLGPAGEGPAVFALLGDSHARMWTAGADQLAHELDLPGIALTYSSCTPLLDAIPPTRPECRAITEAAIDYLARSDIDRIVLAGYWVDADDSFKEMGGVARQAGESILEAGLTRTLDRLARPGRQISILLDVPELDSDKTPLTQTLQSIGHAGAAATGPALAQHRARQQQVETVLRRLQARYGFQLLDPADLLCDAQGCVVARDGQTLYRDRHHLTDPAARQLRQTLEAALR